MASIWKRPDSKYFIACWTDSKGRRLKRSTKMKNRKDAKKIADRYEEESRRKRSATQARQVLSEIYRELSGEELPTMTVREHFDGLIAEKVKWKTATKAYYGGASKRFIEWLGERADRDISEITRQDLIRYRDHVATLAGPRTTNNTLKAVKMFFAKARKSRLLIEDPAVDVETVADRSESARRPFTLPELQAVLAAADDEWKSMIRFGFYTGQRLGDIATLTWGNLDIPRGDLRLTTRKTDRKQTVPFAPALRAHIEKMKPGEPKAPIHPAAFEKVKKKGLTTKLSDQFARLLTKAGLRTNVAADDGNARAKYELSFHSLRHTATSILKDAGIPQSVVMDFIGHDTVDVSHGYTHTGREALEKAAAALPTL